jgi:hypothetical protein
MFFKTLKILYNFRLFRYHFNAYGKNFHMDKRKLAIVFFEMKHLGCFHNTAVLNNISINQIS